MTRRERSVLRAGAATILLLTGLARGVPTYRAWIRGAEAVAVEVEREYERARAAIELHGTLRDTLAARQAMLDTLSGAVLWGESRAAAGASLASLLARTARSVGVEMGAIHVRPDSVASAGLVPVSVRAEAIADTPSLTAWLATLGSTPELLAVSHLTVTQPDPAHRHGPAPLHVGIVVEALARVPRAGR